MKKFTVLWQEDAEAELATLWEQSEDRNSLADSANKIDQVLGESADKVGESREKSERILFHDNFAVHYRVWLADRRVMVQEIWFVG